MDCGSQGRRYERMYLLKLQYEIYYTTDPTVEK